MQTLRCRGLNPLRWSEYSLLAEGVKFRERDFSGTREGIVKYDRIGREPTYFSQQSVIGLLALVLVLIIAAVVGFVEWSGGHTDSYAWLFWLCIAIPFLVYYAGSKQSGYLLSSDFGTVALRGKKSEVESFIVALVDKKLAYIEGLLKRRLSVVDPSEVSRYLLTLCEAGVLADDECQSIRARLGLDDVQEPRIGFLS
jgi:hypothetical protein